MTHSRQRLAEEESPMIGKLYRKGEEGRQGARWDHGAQILGWGAGPTNTLIWTHSIVTISIKRLPVR